MGFAEILTLIFIVFKLTGVITWSWWLVLLPEIIAVVIYAVIVVINLWIIIGTHRELKKFWKEMDKDFHNNEFFK